MGIASSLENYMLNAGVEYDLVHHKPSMTAQGAARNAHVKSDCVAKAVVLKDDQGFIMAVLPSTEKLSIDQVNKKTHRHLALSPEQEFCTLFNDCEVGAVPPIGNAYGMKVMMDQSLEGETDIYFEAGDHENLVHVTDWDFEILMRGAEVARICQH
ncbi:aminoacyl-tRNA deacylase [Sneathiella chinensis]|uniref:Aminoacyl-tRNA deacylase n=1 Tax=Sneathiella chinensis TaxID=349750 RepID=A0ABQ5U3Z7_9PROT|nr:YbaK/EbsC family protein [Sneathiella chinensis]GLQ06466.1 aminoacyl-tRNA deacylase [Sneathiella chinensis]